MIRDAETKSEAIGAALGTIAADIVTGWDAEYLVVHQCTAGSDSGRYSAGIARRWKDGSAVDLE